MLRKPFNRSLIIRKIIYGQLLQNNIKNSNFINLINLKTKNFKNDHKYIIHKVVLY